MKIITFTGLCFMLMAVVALPSCKKDAVVSPIPEIALIDIFANNNGFIDTSATLKFAYSDGDGDLGTISDNTAQDNNVFVKTFEKKNGVFSFLIDQNATIPNLTPTSTNKSIEGEIQYLLQLPIAVTNDTLRYEFYITDRAGHKSNVIMTKEIIVTTQ